MTLVFLKELMIREAVEYRASEYGIPRREPKMRKVGLRIHLTSKHPGIVEIGALVIEAFGQGVDVGGGVELVGVRIEAPHDRFHGLWDAQMSL